MTQPIEMPPTEPHDVPTSKVTAKAVNPSAAVHKGATRMGHSNGLKVHSIVFGSLALGVLVALVVTLVIIASGRM